MSRLIKTDVPSTGQRHFHNGAPAFFVDGGQRYALMRERGHFCLEVIAREVQLVRAVAGGRMKGGFGRRKREDEPAVAGIDRGEAEDVAEEGAVGFGVLGLNDDVRAGDHWVLLGERTLCFKTRWESAFSLSIRKVFDDCFVG